MVVWYEVEAAFKAVSWAEMDDDESGDCEFRRRLWAALREKEGKKLLITHRVMFLHRQTDRHNSTLIFFDKNFSFSFLPAFTVQGIPATNSIRARLVTNSKEGRMID